MTKHFMTGAERTKIIEALKNNPNAAAVARQFGFGETTILRLCKKEGIGLQHLLTKSERTEVVELLKTNLNALATAKQLGINHKTVLEVAKKEGINIKTMRQAAKGRKTLRFTQWARGPKGKPVLQCAVYLNGGRRLALSLNTADTKLEGPQRMRLILWRAIAEGQLPKGKNHPAWRYYGGAIPQSIKRLLRRLASLPWAKYAPLREAAAAKLGLLPTAIDWLTKQQQNRPPHPKQAHFQRSNARRKGKRIPMADSWQCGPVGTMLAVNRTAIYAQLTIDGHQFRWRLAANNREEGKAIVQPAISARSDVKAAMDHWRRYEVGTEEGQRALRALGDAQRRYLEALRAADAERAENWVQLQKLVQQLPLDESVIRRPIHPLPETASKKARRYFAADMKRAKERERAALKAGHEKEARGINRPPIEPHREYLKWMIRKVGGRLTFAAAEEAFKAAQNDAENWDWSKRGRRRPTPKTT
jgi:hypothetical protein